MIMPPAGYLETDLSLALYTGFGFDGAEETDQGIKFLDRGVTHLISFIVAKDTRNCHMLWLDEFNIDKRAVMDGDPLLVLGIEVPRNELGRIGTKDWKPKPIVALYNDYIIREKRLREPVDFFREYAQPLRPEGGQSPELKKADIA